MNRMVEIQSLDHGLEIIQRILEGVISCKIPSSVNDGERAKLILQAVNQYEALLAVKEAADKYIKFLDWKEPSDVGKKALLDMRKALSDIEDK